MGYNLSDVTIGIKTFNRPEKLKMALESLVNIPVKEVIVADDGKRTEKYQEIYREMEKKIPLRVLELPYDLGKPAGLNLIVAECKTRYLMLIDDDMRILSPQTVWILKDILENYKNLGGVSSVLLERGKIKSGAHNLKTKQKYLIRYVPKEVKIVLVNGHPIIEADFIPFSTLFRVDALYDVPWDEHHKIGYEHVDFYLSQKQLGKWKFAISLSSVILHDPGGSRDYRQTRFNKNRIESSKTYFLKKWGLKGIIIKNVEILNRIYCRVPNCLLVPIRERLPLRIGIFASKIEQNFARILRLGGR